MGYKFYFAVFFLLEITSVNAQNKQEYSWNYNSAKKIMSQAYLDLWNSDVQEKIDQGIDRYRKANALLKIEGVPLNGEVQVEQISHEFIFGAQIFNFNQLGTAECNRRYKELFGSLFNSATMGIFWKTFEMQPNRPRFREEYWDTEEYWNQVKEPELEPHWRRPATDPVVEFSEKKGIRLFAHPIIWATPDHHHPEWMFEQFATEEEKERVSKMGEEEVDEPTPAQLAEMLPDYSKEMKKLFEKRVVELAEYYGDRVHSWDVVNESRSDFPGTSITGNEIKRSTRGGGLLVPGDYAYHAFKVADRVFPKHVLLNINDNVLWGTEHYDMYVEQIKDLLVHGSRIDIMGSQMHLFNPQQSLDIAEGKHIKTPEQTWEKMKRLSEVGLPIHVSEITITAPGDDSRGREIQAVIARNLYRIWFSIEKMMGITWWNLVDGGAVAGEPSTSGLFTRNMNPKPSFYALDKLINEEWKTRLTISPNQAGLAIFRGFKGKYRVTWKDESGEAREEIFYLKEDGDGF